MTMFTTGEWIMTAVAVAIMIIGSALEWRDTNKEKQK